MSEDKLRFIIVGGGAAGISAASTIKGLAPDSSL